MKKTVLISLALATSLFAAKIDFQLAEQDIQRYNPELNDKTILSYHSSVEDAKKSVVNIATTKTIKIANNPMGEFFNDPIFKEFFGFGFGFDFPENMDRKSSSLGSGVIISKDGYIVTNNHVVEGADEIIVNIVDDDTEYDAKIIGSDPKTDIAIIKIDKKDLKPIKFSDSSKLLEGDIVFAIGNPFGVGSTITQGIISALNKDNIGLNQYENFIQTDASINPGNSGGALVDSRGALVGINSAILSRSGGNNGIGFAIPSNMVKDVATLLIEDGKIERGYLGVTITDLTKEQKEVYKNKEGALITGVQDKKAASNAGIKRGDLIIKLDDKTITSANELKNTIGALKPGKEIKLTYERDGKISTTKVKLDEMENISIQSKALDSDTIDGLEISNLTDELKKQLRLKDDTKGIIITNIASKSKAEEFGFRKNDIITQVGTKEIKSLDDFKDALKEYKGKNTMVWVIRRGISQGIVIK
ncbi:MAG: DegQ family serine endoprotease [Campylobacter sp.]|nr:DegQ family serine endoprotease [Campylobacter sp.]